MSDTRIILCVYLVFSFQLAAKTFFRIPTSARSENE